MMNSMMTSTVETGTAKKAAFAWPAAGKTGTSQNSRDAWFIGYTANLTTGVWFGNDDGKPMKKVTGGALPAQAWHEFMVAAHEGVPIAAAARHMAAETIGPGRMRQPISRPCRSPASLSRRPGRLLAGHGSACRRLPPACRTVEADGFDCRARTSHRVDPQAGATRRCRRPGQKARQRRSSTILAGG